MLKLRKIEDRRDGEATCGNTLNPLEPKMLIVPSRDNQQKFFVP